jgi:hypothetical protein
MEGFGQMEIPKQTEMVPVPMTREELTRCLEAADYRFAKTIPQAPHWYTQRKTWADEDLFERVVQAIRDHGEKRWWQGRSYVYFDAGEYEYWTGELPPQEELWINRAVRLTE